MDNRGTGYSGRPRGRWTTRAMAQDVLAVLEQLQWARAHVVGISRWAVSTSK